jgi:hypothetical protein
VTFTVEAAGFARLILAVFGQGLADSTGHRLGRT